MRFRLYEQPLYTICPEKWHDLNFSLIGISVTVDVWKPDLSRFLTTGIHPVLKPSVLRTFSNSLAHFTYIIGLGLFLFWNPDFLASWFWINLNFGRPVFGHLLYLHILSTTKTGARTLNKMHLGVQSLNLCPLSYPAKLRQFAIPNWLLVNSNSEIRPFQIWQWKSDFD